ncbi:hypothetical protein PENTCL1PPCAC_2447 [Pristionchus entomophagus]|uniref:Ribosomal protein n=1 Tax=Pristionchus entomophagus TaxID=358040 RepID=A0AAV5SC53_9BILA|nr:hypothetical protein PENTCL1PPCAC_2447 [Pristionchus entomophagus]
MAHLNIAMKIVKETCVECGSGMIEGRNSSDRDASLGFHLPRLDAELIKWGASLCLCNDFPQCNTQHRSVSTVPILAVVRLPPSIVFPSSISILESRGMTISPCKSSPLMRNVTRISVISLERRVQSSLHWGISPFPSVLHIQNMNSISVSILPRPFAVSTITSAIP